MSVSQIVLVGGIKGGTGKSVVSRACIDYMIENHYPYVVVDADVEIQDVKKYYPSAKVIPFSDDPKKILDPNWISSQAVRNPGTTLIVNLPGNAYDSLKEWLKYHCPREGKKSSEGEPQFVMLFVTDGSWASTQMFFRSLEELGDKLPHVYVRNNGSNRSAYGWDFIYERLPQLSREIERHQVLETDFPDINARVMFEVDMQADLIRNETGDPIIEDGEFRFYTKDEDRPKTIRGYRFKDACEHPDPMIGRRFYYDLPNIYDFFDQLFQNSPFLFHPSDYASGTQVEDGSSKEVAQEATGASQDLSPDTLPELPVLMMEELPDTLQAEIATIAKSVQCDSGAILQAIANLPYPVEEKGLRGQFANLLGRKGKGIPTKLSTSLLLEVSQLYYQHVVLQEQVA